MAKCAKCGYDPDQVSSILVKQSMNRFVDDKTKKVIVVNSELPSLTINNVVFRREDVNKAAEPVKIAPKAVEPAKK